MFFEIHLEDLFRYILKKESNQFFTSIAIRYLALGMIGIFEPVYLYLYFGGSVSYVLLFWAAYSGIFGLTVVFGGRALEKFGLKHTMLLSNFFFFAYYLCLFFLYDNFLLLPAAIILRAIGATLFWPAFHTDFVRFSKANNRAEHVSRLSIIALLAGVISPVIGGLILAGLGYAALFTVVLITLFASTFPLFLSRERHEVYSDSYKKAWQRIAKNKDISFALASLGVEGGIDAFLWPIFIFTLGVTYRQMGGISTFTLFVAVLFAWYMGKAATKRSKGQLLNLGAVFLAMSWIIKYFVVDVLSAFLAQNLYRISKTSTLIPFKTILYDKAAAKKQEADEFIVYREIIINITRLFFFLAMAGVFFVVPQINISFFIAVLASLGFSFLAKPRPFSFKKLSLGIRRK